MTTASKQRHETLNKLLAQADDTSAAVDDQKQRIKVAFAEGYLAANTEDKLGVAAKFVKVIFEFQISENSHCHKSDICLFSLAHFTSHHISIVHNVGLPSILGTRLDIQVNLNLMNNY